MRSADQHRHSRRLSYGLSANFVVRCRVRYNILEICRRCTQGEDFETSREILVDSCSGNLDSCDSPSMQSFEIYRTNINLRIIGRLKSWSYIKIQYGINLTLIYTSDIGLDMDIYHYFNFTFYEYRFLMILMISFAIEIFSKCEIRCYSRWSQVLKQKAERTGFFRHNISASLLL